MWLPFESRLLLGAASVVVPSYRRSEWRREWDAELWCWLQGLPNAGHSPFERASVTARDTEHLSMRSVSVDRRAVLRSRLRGGFAGTPGAWVAAACLVLLALAIASGGFRHTRQALFYGPDC